MSKIAIKGNESGTATFTIEAPATNTDRVLELPDEAGKVLTDVSDIEPQVKTATNASGAAPIYACRAWVNFDGTGTVSIRASGNVSSVTRNGTGDYTINFTTAMPDGNYSAVATCVQRPATGVNRSIGFHGDSSEVATTYSTTSVRLLVLASNGVALDQIPITLAIFR